MPIHVCLLRGINVGGHRKVPMPALRAALEADGYGEVATYVQSGNVVLRAPADETPARTGGRLAAVVAAAFDLDDVPVLVRTAAEVEALVAEDPFDASGVEERHRHVLFLGDALDPQTLRSLEPTAPEALVPGASGRELHLLTPDGIGRSAFAAKLTDRRLETVVTTRNRRTIGVLAQLAAAG